MVHAPSHAKEHQAPGQEQGRWEWIKDRGEYTALVFRHPEGGGNYILTPECEVGDYGLSCEKTIDVSDKHANLIAAAPDLLEALKDIMQRDAGRGDLTVEHARAAFAAIDRAEGRQ